MIPFLRDQIIFHRNRLSSSEKKVSKPSPKYPLNIEREYDNQIKDWMKLFTKPTKQFILENFTRWKKELKVDSFYSEEDEYVRYLEEQQKRLYEEQKSQRLYYLLGIAGAVSMWEMEQFKKELVSFGVAFYDPSEPWVAEVLQNWANTNLTLIKTMTQEYISKANTVISNGVLNNFSLEEITKEITKLNVQMVGGRRKISEGVYKTIKGRSSLIARDQVGKLNGELTKRRMLEAGMSTYNWLTALDERVRGNPLGVYPKAIPSHYIMESLTFSWEDSSIYSEDNGITWKPKTATMETAIPGGAIGCRCVAGTNTFAVLKDVEKE